MSTQGAPEERPDYSAIWTGEEMILWGGYGGSGSSDLDDGGRYDPLQDSWQPVSATGIGSDRHSAVWTGQKMIVWGELNASYDPSTDGWALISDVNDPIDRDDPTAVWTGSQMIVWGGTRFRHVFNSGGRYDPVNDSWTPTAGPPEARAGHSAVWTGSEMLVWGGEVENGYRLDVGSRYDPLLDSWSPMATLDAPEGRADHHAFWTGDRMLVWGGWLDLRSGGRYDPLTDDWTPTSLPGIVPDARDPTAVWTGDEMLVWGGIRSGDCDLYQSDYGARYDPFTDQWQSLAIDDATPEPRFDHVAVWTGSEMIVWGGTALSGPRDEFSECVGRVDFRNGAKYDPGLDRWTTISSADPSLCPLGMDAVWTGTEMIVWNGSNGSRYDPVVDLWAAVSSENDPAPGDTMLWAGSEMIVWGGVSGGRYEPTTDSWRLTSTVDAPVSRNRHTAVWTGEAMIVWGGNYRNNPVNIQIPHFNSGGRYFVGNPDGDHDGVADDCDTCTDTDGDGWGNPGFPGNTCAGDNCPEVPNPTQANGDPDPFGNACDNCPSIDNLDQQDLDADGLGDACDDCALDPDNDADADGICGDVDACPADPDNDADADGQCGDTDCQPADPSDRTPPVVDDLHGEKLVAGAVRLSWSAMGSADAYSLSRGLLTSLPTGDYGACLVDGLVSPSYEDGALPGAGEGFVYLVQAQNDDCGLGALGPDSTGAERLNAAGAACEGASHADSYPVSEASVYGTVSGDLTATAASDGVYESITEEESSGGPPSNRRSLLEHRWTIDVAPGDRIELHVEGSRSSSPDGDDFVFEYSDDGGASWNAIAMSTLPLADDQVDRVGTLPNTLAGSVIFRVVDTNRDEGHLELDELTIDELFVRNVP
jgi:N-acetylneuraminic acid mutarotase